ncbi:MAG: hypothetical protein BWY45_02258 [Euryarchaeota archaeon ADurb.Bin294]|nr:MAG: hypothetical protein BWY45_02258 [Euryarchaeota archaeon ADurb.Bin294]
MVAKRVNLTIEGDLHDKATSYADERGMSFSALVAKAVSQYMKTGDHTPITPESILLKMSPEERTGLMRPIVSEMIDEFMLSEKGRDYLLNIVTERRESIPPVYQMEMQKEGDEPQSQIKEVPRRPAPPAPKSGSVTITDEFRERLKKFGPTAIEKVSGVGKGDISKMQRGLKDGISEKNYQKLEAGIAILEADAAKNAVLPSE